mgnify:FL=1
MFFKLIERKRNEWFSSPACTVKDFIDYIVRRGEMRDAQIESIRTYLYLKIACENKPLWKLFAEGAFNDPDYELNPAEYGTNTYRTIKNNAGAMALMQYAQPDPKSAPKLPKLKELLRIKAEDIDYEAAFKSIFYDEDYTDYVFSLPMGAGKTYLMAAFIYIDLYFASKDENNPVWAHNFMIFAPSGTKSSILPSLRNIMRFDPSWVIPEPEASRLKRMVTFEILDQQRTPRDSNQVKNPNAQKIRLHQQNNEQMGLVAITNAEKVILDRIDKKDAQPELFQTAEQKKEWEQIKVANELRDVIGRIPNLAVFVDEVHHVADRENKLKQVIENWTEANTFSGMIGFSGTPYLKKPYRITIGTEQPLKDSSMATVVYYYPLASGIKNFLKTPRIEDSELPSRELLDKGVRDFLDNYMDVAYDIEGDGQLRKAKLAIFCRSIANLERDVYPQVSQIVAEYGMAASDVLLPYHKGGKEGSETFPAPKDAEREFQRLDEDSQKRIVLLVRIGQEGWDCKSLAGVIMPYDPDTKSPQNSVLQRTCRCLRQAVKFEDETALIWLNRANAAYLDQQLREEQNSSLAEIRAAVEKDSPSFQRYSRMGRQRVPEIPFYQLELNHVEKIDEVKPDTKAVLESDDLLIKAKQFNRNTREEDFLEIKDSTTDLAGREVPMTFTEWFYLMLKEGANYPDEEMLLEYEAPLRRIFSTISTEKEDGRYLSAEYDHEAVREAVRRAFLTERTAVYRREEIRRDAHIMVIRHNGETEKINDSRRLADFQPADESKYFPNQQTVKEIVHADDNPPALSVDEREFVDYLRQKGDVEKADRMERRFLEDHQLSTDARHKDATYQYLPYRFDSDLERDFFRHLLASVQKQHLEMYFNGDEQFTSFIIKPYKVKGNDWEALQQYVPDFLVLSRREDGSIDRVLIIETKGQLYADSFKDKRDYMTGTFLELNSNREGLPEFRFLYLEADKDNKNLPQLEAKTRDTIKTFFKLK